MPSILGVRMHLIATRVYHDWNPVSGEEYELRDRMLRKVCGSFVLMVAGELPGEPEVEKPCSLDGVFYWLQECPEQIERTVIHGKAYRPLFDADEKAWEHTGEKLRSLISQVAERTKT
jgi:hypothetical protein